MSLHVRGLLGLAILVTALGASAADCECDYADKAALQIGAERLIDGFASQARDASHHELGGLAIRVENTPSLVYFSPKQQAIVVPWWAELGPDMQGIFVQLAGDPAKGKHLFNLLFNRFFIAHEAGHWLQSSTRGAANEEKPDFYKAESEANRIAVAYWMTTPGGDAYLAEMEGLLTPILARMPNPVPDGSRHDEYFNAHYAELGSNPMAYGWFQFRFVLDAIAQRNQLRFPKVVESVFSPGAESGRIDGKKADSSPGP